MTDVRVVVKPGGVTALIAQPPSVRIPAVGQQGPKGVQGAKGDTGSTGPAGATGPQGATGAQGLQGVTGPAGADGNTVLYGAVDPASGTGVDGNFYINTASHTLFGPKASGAWPAGTSIVGPQGSTGSQGATGPTGATGQGVPAGGTSGQVLAKNSNTDYDDHWITPAAGVAGSDTQVQFNDSGALAGNANFTYDKSTNTLTLNGAKLVGSANVLEQRSGASAQESRLYEVYTDAANYGRLTMRFASGIAYLRSEAAGTGSVRSLALWGNDLLFASNGSTRWQINTSGHLLPFANSGNDNAFDFGSASWHVRTGYFGTSVAVGATAPAYSFHALGGGMRAQAIATPAAPTVTPTGAAGATAYTYYIVAKDQFGNKTLASAAGTTATGNAVLSATNYNTITWAAVTGAASYDVLKADTGHSIAVGITTTTFNDVGAASAVYTAPTRNATADLTADGLATLDGWALRGAGWGTGSAFSIGGTIVAGASGAITFGGTAGGSGVVLGYTADGTGAGSAVVVGYTAKAPAGTGPIALGANASATGNASIALGYGAVSPAAKTMVVGNASDPNLAIADAYFGSGYVSAAPQAFALHASGGSGTDITGANLTLAGGQPTGAGVGGSIFFSTAAAGTTGATLRALTQRWRIDQSGNLLAAAGAGVFQPRSYTVSQLPSAATVPGARASVSDSTAAASGNFAATLTGGGANTVPVWSDGTNWRIG